VLLPVTSLAAGSWDLIVEPECGSAGCASLPWTSLAAGSCDLIGFWFSAEYAEPKNIPRAKATNTDNNFPLFMDILLINNDDKKQIKIPTCSVDNFASTICSPALKA
jgi:hypothetical protein